MKIIEGSTQINLREKGSKFLGYLFPCETLNQFDEQLHQIKSTHPTATHHCYAYRFNPTNIIEYSSDDGEPSGTAGLPILNQLKSNQLVNTGAVIVRYFGGTKLGKTGLIDAYGETTRLCISSANKMSIQLMMPVKILYQYSHQNIINKLKLSYQLTELQAEYLEDVSLTLGCLPEFHKALIKELQKVEHLGISHKQLEPIFLTVS